MNKTKIFLVIFTAVLTGCTSLTLTPANFAWPIENVVTTDNTGSVVIDRYSTEFNASNLFKAEFGDSTEIVGKELRVIRDQFGFYFMTAEGFMNVYVFEVDNGKFVQSGKIFITKDGMTNPALNQRAPNIELLDDGRAYILDNKGVKER
jgi:hypothetical protein